VYSSKAMHPMLQTSHGVDQPISATQQIHRLVRTMLSLDMNVRYTALFIFYFIYLFTLFIIKSYTQYKTQNRQSNIKRVV